MNIGDKVQVSPDLTGLDIWLPGIVTEVEDNPFNGIVITIKADNGRMFFGQIRFFKPINANDICTQ
ncbi:MAG: hypothetical protein LUD46_03585 [Parabacteroides sp.]|nr:hypothetical protein [Parabacteroides sp.]